MQINLFAASLNTKTEQSPKTPDGEECCPFLIEMNQLLNSAAEADAVPEETALVMTTMNQSLNSATDAATKPGPHDHPAPPDQEPVNDPVDEVPEPWPATVSSLNVSGTAPVPVQSGISSVSPEPAPQPVAPAVPVLEKEMPGPAPVRSTDTVSAGKEEATDQEPRRVVNMQERASRPKPQKEDKMETKAETSELPQAALEAPETQTSPIPPPVESFVSASRGEQASTVNDCEPHVQPINARDESPDYENPARSVPDSVQLDRAREPQIPDEQCADSAPDRDLASLVPERTRSENPRMEEEPVVPLPDHEIDREIDREAERAGRKDEPQAKGIGSSGSSNARETTPVRSVTSGFENADSSPERSKTGAIAGRNGREVRADSENSRSGDQQIRNETVLRDSRARPEPLVARFPAVERNPGNHAQNFGTLSFQLPAAKSAEATIESGTKKGEPDGFISQLAERIRIQVSAGNESVRIRLQPDRFGHLEIRAEATANGVVARIVAESEGVRSYLENNLNVLQQTLSEHGIKVDRLSVSVGSGSDLNALADHATETGHGGSGYQGRQAPSNRGKAGLFVSASPDESVADPAARGPIVRNGRFYTVA